MKQTSLAAALMVMVACAIATAAQRTQLPAPTNEPAHNVFVLTGCLASGNAPSAFKLTNASVIGQAPPRSSASATSSKDAEVYDLQAAASVSQEGLSREKLQADVGAKVEVTIRPVETTSPPPPLTTPKDGAEKPAELPRQRYTVIKLNRLADACA